MDINNNLWWSTIVLKGKEERGIYRRAFELVPLFQSVHCNFYEDRQMVQIKELVQIE